jgi:aarF domain-containing kinase
MSTQATTAPHAAGLHPQARERRVPASRVSRVAQFGSLVRMAMCSLAHEKGVSLGFGAVGELGRRLVGMHAPAQDSRLAGAGSSQGSAFMTEANMNRVVGTLCRVRGAALKLGQVRLTQVSVI